MYTYQGQSVATYEQLVPVLKAKNSKQLSNIYYAHKEDLTQDSDIYSLDNSALYEFRKQNNIVGCRRLHLFSVSGAHKLAKFGKLDSSHIDEAYGVTTAEEDVKPVERPITKGIKVNASYSCFEIVDGVLKLSKKVGIPIQDIIEENKQLKIEQSRLIDTLQMYAQAFSKECDAHKMDSETIAQLVVAVMKQLQ